MEQVKEKLLAREVLSEEDTRGPKLSRAHLLDNTGTGP
jgi:hypothetical protein